MDYLHDGSFEGILSSIYTMFHQRAKPSEDRLIFEENYQYEFGGSFIRVNSDSENALKVVKSILETFGEEGFKVVLYSYLAEASNYGDLLFKFLKRAYKLGNNAISCLSDNDIYEIYQLYRRVVRESHLMLGLVRFARLESDIYYSQYEPTYDLTSIIAPHFADRLKNQMWVIHDTKRNVAVFYDTKKWYIRDLNDYEAIVLSEDELQYQKLWKAYFEHIAIPERKSLKRQMNFMPKKYWQFLTEKKA